MHAAIAGPTLQLSENVAQLVHGDRMHAPEEGILGKRAELVVGKANDSLADLRDVRN
jgi:hypothetical protein